MQQITKTQKINLSTTEIAKLIRKELKEKFPQCKFSVRSEYYSMGSSITISIMKANFKVKADLKDVDCTNYLTSHDLEQIEKLQNNKYHQLNPYTLREEYRKDSWCNGVFLTEKAHKVLQEVVKIADKYNWDESDPMTDYYDVNFAFHIEVGKWNKEFEGD